VFVHNLPIPFNSSEFDQELDSLLVGPIPVGVNKFVFEADPPNVTKLPASEILGVTVILLSCAYDGREFVRVGYYVSHEYDTPELQAEPPKQHQLDRIVRNMLTDKPRVTRFAIKWYVPPWSSIWLCTDIKPSGTPRILLPQSSLPNSLGPTMLRMMLTSTEPTRLPSRPLSKLRVRPKAVKVVRRAKMSKWVEPRRLPVRSKLTRAPSLKIWKPRAAVNPMRRAKVKMKPRKTLRWVIRRWAMLSPSLRLDLAPLLLILPDLRNCLQYLSPAV
jgi:hypothetical protein